MEYAYKPSTNLLEGIRNAFPLEIAPWDDYFPRMAQTEFLSGRHEAAASKSYFIRKAPFNGAYALMGGLTSFLRTLQDFEFNDVVCEALKDMGYQDEFIQYLQNRRKLDLKVYAVPEGSVFFPNEPAVSIEGDIVSVRMAEGMLLPSLNYPSLAMTKWHRVVQAGSPGICLEFARRRAQAPLSTSLYAHLAGAAISSNSEIRRGFNVPITGTMGHEFIQSFPSEYDAFDTWLTHNPDKPVLLVDTIDTLKSGVPNAITTLKKHAIRIKKAGGKMAIRNDSGDLVYLTLEERATLDRSGLEEVKIIETNDLDEHKIESMRQQIFMQAPKAGMDPERVLSTIIWACGTQPGTCADQPSIGGVMKLMSMEARREERAVIKLARDNPVKTSIPGANRSAWVMDRATGELLCCLIHRREEKAEDSTSAYHPDDEMKQVLFRGNENLRFIPRQQLVYEDRKILTNPTLAEVRERVKTETRMLHWTHKRLENPHRVKVSLSRQVFELRKKMIMNNSLMDL